MDYAQLVLKILFLRNSKLGVECCKFRIKIHMNFLSTKQKHLLNFICENVTGTKQFNVHSHMTLLLIP